MIDFPSFCQQVTNKSLIGGMKTSSAFFKKTG